MEWNDETLQFAIRRQAKGKYRTHVYCAYGLWMTAIRSDVRDSAKPTIFFSLFCWGLGEYYSTWNARRKLIDIFISPIFFFLIPSIGYFFRFLIAWRAVFTSLFLGKKKRNERSSLPESQIDPFLRPCSKFHGSHGGRDEYRKRQEERRWKQIKRKGGETAVAVVCGTDCCGAHTSRRPVSVQNISRWCTIFMGFLFSFFLSALFHPQNIGS